MAALASDWLIHFQLLLWNRWTEFNETWQEARFQGPLPSLCFSGWSKKTRWPPWPLIGWDIFDFSSETAEWNSTKLDRKQGLNTLYQVCVFFCRSEKQDGHPGLWLAETFSTSPLKSLNGIQRNLNWQEARSHHPLPSLCFSGRSEKQNGRPGLWLAEAFLTSPLKLLNGIQWNLTESKISTSSTKISKQKCPPWSIP